MLSFYFYFLLNILNFRADGTIACPLYDFPDCLDLKCQFPYACTQIDRLDQYGCQRRRFYCSDCPVQMPLPCNMMTCPTGTTCTYVDKNDFKGCPNLEAKCVPLCPETDTNPCSTVRCRSKCENQQSFTNGCLTYTANCSTAQ
jgi:hypothetical protein